jgi:hypothetical protein
VNSLDCYSYRLIEAHDDPTACIHHHGYICIFQISSEYLILLVASVACRQNLDFSLIFLGIKKVQAFWLSQYMSPPFLQCESPSVLIP